MNANDIFTALTGIDEKYIDEAAYELHPGDIATGSEEQKPAGKVVDITSRRRAGKFVKIVLPSVAAIILIVAVALPAVLRVTHNASTSAMSESAAPAAADEAAAEAPAEAESPAAAAEAPAADNFEPIAEAPSVATEEAEEASEDAAVAEAETAGKSAPEEDNAYKTARGDEAQMLTAGKGLAVAEADYNDGILTIEFDSDLPAGFADTPYRLTRSDTGEGSLVSEGVLSELSDHIDTEDNRLIIDLTGGKLPTGTYRLSFGDTFAQFEVK
ncbi:MAG: hypothetical protein IJI51_04880 [Lachnospiraceae bacterium]|nr:hypothetical protein [Lachnospiraceae bacterium]